MRDHYQIFSLLLDELKEESDSKSEIWNAYNMIKELKKYTSSSLSTLSEMIAN